MPKIPEVTTAPVPTQQEQIAQNYAAVPPMPAPDNQGANTNQPTGIEIQELITAQKAQQEEIQKLKRQLRKKERYLLQLLHLS